MYFPVHQPPFLYISRFLLSRLIDEQLCNLKKIAAKNAMSKLGIKAHKCLESKHLTQVLLSFPLYLNSPYCKGDRRAE